MGWALGPEGGWSWSRGRALAPEGGVVAYKPQDRGFSVAVLHPGVLLSSRLSGVLPFSSFLTPSADVETLPCLHLGLSSPGSFVFSRNHADVLGTGGRRPPGTR